MSNNIEGKVVVITGASSGLGEATARLLSAQGGKRCAGCAARRSHPVISRRTDRQWRQGTRHTDRRHSLEKTRGIMTMYVRGLYAFYIHKMLLQDMEFDFFRFGKSEKLNEVLRMLNESGGSYGRIGNGDIFECVFGHAADAPEAGIWILNFLRRALFVVIATPQNVGQSAGVTSAN